MQLRVFGIVNDSIVDGPGFRLSVFVQGCSHHCPGCHNPESHDPQGGSLKDIEEIVAMVKKNPLLSGITLSGGEPMEQAEGCLALLKALPENLNRWIYSGYTFEALLAKGDPQQLELLRSCDVLVDGPFLLAERSLELKFRGSRNQRLIDLKKTFENGNVPVLWTPPAW